MAGLAIPAIGLATKVLEFLNRKHARKYIDKLVEIKKEILEEESKGYWGSDTKIENLHKELKIIMEAVENEISISGPPNNP